MAKIPNSSLYVCLICDYKPIGMIERELIAHIQTSHYRIFRKAVLQYGDKLPYLKEMLEGKL